MTLVSPEQISRHQLKDGHGQARVTNSLFYDERLIRNYAFFADYYRRADSPGLNPFRQDSVSRERWYADKLLEGGIGAIAIAEVERVPIAQNYREKLAQVVGVSSAFYNDNLKKVGLIGLSVRGDFQGIGVEEALMWSTLQLFPPDQAIYLPRVSTELSSHLLELTKGLGFIATHYYYEAANIGTVLDQLAKRGNNPALNRRITV